MKLSRHLIVLLVLFVFSRYGFSAETTNRLHITFPDARLTVNGLAWFEEDKPVLHRLPARLKETFRKPVWDLAQDPAGGRIRFQTDSLKLVVIAQNPNASTMHHMTSVGQNGLDLYVDGHYIGSAWPDKDAKIRADWRLGETPQMRDVTIYLPLYKPITVSELIFDPGASIQAPSKFALPKPVVYYGSSITQGGCAENPGLSYQAIVSRWLNVDHVNLGFSGNGLGELAVAQAIAEIDAAAFVLDYWGNPSSEVYRTTMPVFVDTLRAKYPKTPILITGAYYFSNEVVNHERAATQNEKRKIASDFVAARRKAGDKNVYFVDGREMLSPEQAEGLVDGVHANSLGFYFCAKGLEPYLRKALGLSAGRTKHY